MQRRDLRRILRILPRRTLQRLQAVASPLLRPDYSVLAVHSDLSGWVLDEEAREITRTARRLGIRAHLDLGLSRGARQCIHYTSQFVLEADRIFDTRNRVSIDYFHGRPESPEFRPALEGLRRHHPVLARLRVSHSEMEDVVLASGIARHKVHRIPIGVALDLFPLQTADSRRHARDWLGLPQEAAIVGSFQKDGVGWDEGLEPKLVKGPDVLLEALRALRTQVPTLHVLLTGAARGYVMRGLERAGIPYRHVRLRSYADVARCFQALDAYIVSSRQEGGPKAALEAMAAGVPLVTTRVGQAMDLVRHGENGWMVPVEDAAGLAHYAGTALSDTAARARLVESARQTAQQNSYVALAARWAALFRGYVEAR